MKLRCENCHAEFQYDPPTAGDIPLFVPCVECEFPNAVPGGGQKAEVGDTVYTRCFNCGRQLVHDPSLAIPVCKNCQEGEEQNASAKEWMVKKLSGQIYGPFDAETIQTWIESNKIDPRDEVARMGGQWKKFDAHPTFSRLFPGAAGAAAVAAPPTHTIARTLPGAQAAAKAAEKKNARPIDFRGLAENAIGVVGLIGAVAGSYFLLDSHLLVVPEPWLESASAFYREQISARLFAPKEERSAAELAMIPLLDALKQKHPAPKESSLLLFLRGRDAFLQDTNVSLERARTLLEQAVVADPHNDLALAALAELYGTLGEPSLQQDALKLVDEADRLNRGSAEVNRARAAIAVALKRSEDASTAAQETLRLNPQDAEAELYLGKARLVEGAPNYSEALKHLEKAISMDERLHKAYHELGVVYLNQHQFHKAADAFQRTLKLDPRNERALTDYGRLLEEVGETPKAIEVYEKAHKSTEEGVPAASLSYAILLYQARGQHRAAIEVLRGLTPPDQPPRLSIPEHKSALMHMATAQRLSGDAPGALTTLSRVLKDDPGYAPALFQQGLTYLVRGELDNAGKALRAASAAVNDKELEADIKFYLAEILRAQGKKKDAMDELTDAIEDFKFNLRLHVARARLLLELGQADEALNAMREASRLDMVYPAKRGLRTEYFHQPPNPGSALPLFNNLVQDKGYLAEPHLGVALLFMASENRGAAQRAFSQAVEANERNPAGSLHLGILAVEQGNARGGFDLLNRALEFDSQLGLAYIYQARAQLALGQLQAANALLEKATQYERNNPVLQETFGLLAARKGESEAARKAFGKSIALDRRYLPARRALYRLSEG